MTDPAPTWLLASAILLVAAALHAVVGFGFNLVASPLLALMFEPRQSVPALIVMWIPLSAWLALTTWRKVRWKRVALLLAGAILGLPVGAYVLSAVDKETMGVAIGMASVVAALALGVGVQRRVRAERAGCVAVGVVSGVLCTTSAISGPPLVLFGINQGWEGRGLRADLMVYFTGLNVAALVALAYQQVFTPASAAMALRLVPGAVAGAGLGLWLSRRLQPTRYRTLALVVIIIFGMVPLLAHYCL